jgi:hypothetical protein
MFRYACMRNPAAADDLHDDARLIQKELRADGSVVGYIDDQPIPEAVVDEAGHRYSFAGVAPRRPDGSYDIRSLHQGEWIVEPGLVYS